MHAFDQPPAGALRAAVSVPVPVLPYGHRALRDHPCHTDDVLSVVFRLGNDARRSWTDFARFDDLLAAVQPGSEGLIFLPYLEGERSPIYDSDARGVFFGINSSHRRHHFLRATIEGVSYGLRSCLDVMRETIEVPALRLIGGGGQSEAWQQILADVCEVNVQTLTTRAADATSVGAALAAGVGVGIFDSLAEAAETIGVVKERPPRAESAEIYERLFDIYMALYPALKPLYRRLQKGKR
jgi:xylulokinase